MSFWKKVSMLGVYENMPVFVQKSTILYNQIIRILILFFVIGTFITYSFGLRIVPTSFLFIIPFLGFTLFMNFKGKVQQSIILVSTLLPLFFIVLSVVAKLNGEGRSLYLYFIPRLIIIMFGMLPVALIGFSNQKKALLGMLTSIILFLGYDAIHNFFGIHIQDMPYLQKHFLVFQGATTGIFFFITVLLFFLQNINNTYEKLVIQQRDELVEKNEEILAQKEEIETQRDEIFKQNRSITDSILYAQRIQSALLPEMEHLQNNFHENFILFKPRDIVSGDFYWFKEVKSNSNKLFMVTAADCTGHGVPGAFMSMLGMSYLNEISANQQVENAAVVLEHLREHVKTELKQTGQEKQKNTLSETGGNSGKAENMMTVKDGMDISFCVIDTQNMKLHWAGANNPLYIYRKGELLIWKANKNPIGVHIKEVPFTNHEIELMKEDVIYMFSDGYVDQFGGERGEKFKTKRFKALLQEIGRKKLSEQNSILDKTINDWKKNQEQVDDILVIGLKV